MNENNFINNHYIFNEGGFSLETTNAFINETLTDNSNNEIFEFNKIGLVLDSNLQVNYEIPEKYIRYGSFTELLDISVSNIVKNFPYSIKIKKENQFGVLDINVFDIVNQNANQSFKIKKVRTTNSNFINAFIDNILESVFLYEGIEYQINEITDLNDDILLNVKGRPFNDIVPISISAFITYNENYRKNIINQFNSFERYLLNPSFKFRINETDQYDKNIFYHKEFTWPKTDDLNIVYEGSEYVNFIMSLKEVTDKFDKNITNIVKRKLVPQSVQNSLLSSGDNPSLGKINVLINLIGYFIDNLNKQSLENIDRTIELDYISKTDRLKIFNFLKLNGVDLSSNIHNDKLFFLFTNYFFFEQNKNRKEIFFNILNLLGISDELIEYKEHYYKYDKLNMEYVRNIILEQYELNDLIITETGDIDFSKINEFYQSNNYINNIYNLLDVSLGGPYIKNEISAKINYKYFDDFNLEDTWFNLSSSDSCFSFSGDVLSVFDIPVLDECECPLDIENLSYRYQVTHQNPYDNNCPKLLLDIVPECVSFVSSGNTEIDCTNQLLLTSLSDNPNTVNLSANEFTATFSYNLIVNSNCEEDVTYFRENIGNIEVYRCYTNDNDQFLMNSGFVNTIRVYSSLDNEGVDINLNPYTSPYMNGVYGNYTTSDLLYENINWVDNLQNLIYNALDEIYGASLAINFIVQITDDGQGYFEICFLNKNNPQDINYNIGIKKEDSLISFYDGQDFFNLSESFIKLDADNINDSVTTNIGTLTISNNLSPFELSNAIDGDYNTIEIINEEVTLDGQSSGVTTLSGTTTLPINEGDVVNGAYLNFRTWGGEGELRYIGNQPNDFIFSGDTFFSYFIDENDCVSNLFSGTVLCPNDPCLLENLIERTRTVTNTITTTETISCDDIVLDWSLASVISPNNGDPTSFILTLIFPDYMTSGIQEFSGRVVSSSGSYVFQDNQDNTTYAFEFTLDNTIEQTFQFFINVLTNTDCREYSYNSQLTFIPQQGNGGTERAIITKEDVIIETQTTESFEETYFELQGGYPTLTSEIICDEGSNTALVTLTASGGTQPYTFYGLDEENVITDNGEYVAYVIDENGCRSENLTVVIDCINEIECDPLELNTALEVISIEESENTVRCNFNFLIERFSSLFDIDTVNVVLQGINGTETYMLGNPIVMSFNGETGARDIYFDFSPDNITLIFIEVYMTITTDSGCTYTSRHTLNVDGNILSDVDSFQINLT